MEKYMRQKPTTSSEPFMVIAEVQLPCRGRKERPVNVHILRFHRGLWPEDLRGAQLKSYRPINPILSDSYRTSIQPAPLLPPSLGVGLGHSPPPDTNAVPGAAGGRVGRTPEVWRQSFAMPREGHRSTATGPENETRRRKSTKQIISFCCHTKGFRTEPNACVLRYRPMELIDRFDGTERGNNTECVSPPKLIDNKQRGEFLKSIMPRATPMKGRVSTVSGAKPIEAMRT